MVKNRRPLYITAVVTVGAVMAAGLFFSLRRDDAPSVTAPVIKLAYVALGDSVAAGVGLPTDSDSSACNRTDESYPGVLAGRQNYQLTNLACSGATLAAGVLGEQVVNRLAVPGQSQRLPAAAPDLITVTVGANDVGWTEFIRRCYTGQCGTAADSALVEQRLVAVDSGMRQLLTDIGQRYAADPPNVIVTGYYQVFPAGAEDCSDLTGIDQAERAWGRGVQTAISTTVQQAVAESGMAARVRFTPINFDGHELCTTDTWVQGIADRQPYHPTKDGQAAIAAQLQTVVAGMGTAK